MTGLNLDHIECADVMDYLRGLREQIVDTQAEKVYDPTNHIQKGRALLEAAPTTSQRMEVR
jgi:hypothetical protein